MSANIAWMEEALSPARLKASVIAENARANRSTNTRAKAARIASASNNTIHTVPDATRMFRMRSTNTSRSLRHCAQKPVGSMK
jgi:hypothetical protein